jgi:hypothetical protein
LKNEEIMILEFSREEASLGARYAREKHSGYRLDESLLRSRANSILRDMKEHKKSFEEARKNVLEKAGFFPWTNGYSALKSALGEMFSRRSATKHKFHKSPTIPTIMEENGQRAWKF